MFERKAATGEKLSDVVAAPVREMLGISDYHLGEFFERAF
jgi:hypothetical protein